jgi:polysaccharide export outer membrane protein
LQTLSAAEETQYEEFANAEDPTPEDLEVLVEDYVIGPGDTVDLQIFELLAPDTPYVVRVVVDDLGYISIQHVGKLKAAGLSSSQLERRVAEILHPNILKDPSVNAVVVGRTQRTFSIVGAVREPYRYPIDKPDYRLIDALAQAQDVSQINIPYIYVIRRPKAAVEYKETSDAGLEAPIPAGKRAAPVGPPELSPEEELQELLESIPRKSSYRRPGGLSEALHLSAVSARPPGGSAGEQASAELSPVTTARRDEERGRDFHWPAAGPRPKAPFAGRVIRIPLDELLAGNENYNIVIRKDDVVHVPFIDSGFYYVMGNVNRPGTYGIGAIPVTLTRAIAAAGSIGVLAEPAKVDLVRRLGPDRQEIVQLDLAKIFAGLQPDYYIKKDDIINIGTSPISPWLAVLRNGFRATYGFGFVYDRNYADRDVGEPFQWPNLSFW